MIGFDAGERRLTARLLAGEFVRYRSRFPEEFGCTADLPAEAFAEAVRRVALVAERGTPVQLTFAPGRVTVGAATQGQARARESVPADFAGDEPVIAFSPHYLLDGVLAATATAPVTPAAARRPGGRAIDRAGRARRSERAGQALVHEPEQARRDHPPARPGRSRGEGRRGRLPLPRRPPARPVIAPAGGATDAAPSATGRAASGRPPERRAGRTAGP